MTGVFHNVTLVNIYATSGAERRREREQFFSSELSYLLQGIPTSLLVAGDFNSDLTHADTTGHQNYSRTLQELIRGLELVDMWETFHGRATYTHYKS
jgi:exonuclease III